MSSSSWRMARPLLALSCVASSLAQCSSNIPRIRDLLHFYTTRGALKFENRTRPPISDKTFLDSTKFSPSNVPNLLNLFLFAFPGKVLTNPKLYLVLQVKQVT